MTNDQIYRQLYSLRPDCDQPDPAAVRVLMANLRNRIEAIGLTTQNARAIGYRLVPYDG